MAKNRKIEVKGVVIAVSERNQDDFISLTDIASGFEGGSALIEKWLRNSSTIQYLGTWESVNNPNFNVDNYNLLLQGVGTNRFVMSAKKWIEVTSAIGITATQGRYGGTYASIEIALDFASWLNPTFKLKIMSKIAQNALHNKEILDDVLLSNLELKRNDPCYLYLMQDMITKLYKVGISKNITYREKTLQSQKPIIFMLFHKILKTRQEAFTLEQKIHKEYASNRIRGEWFNFSSLDLQNIEDIFNNID